MRPLTTGFLVLAWSVSVLSCGWESSLSAAGSLAPDTLITVRGERGQRAIVIRGKAADFGQCPPPAEDAIFAPIRKAQYTEQYDEMEYGEGDLFPVDACVDVQPAKGEILWTVRGGCNFVNKTLTAMRAEAVAVLVANAGSRMQSETELTAMGCPSSSAVLCDGSLVPTVFISGRDSRRLSELQLEEEQGGGALQASLSAIPPSDLFWQWLTLAVVCSLLILAGGYVSPFLEQRAASTGLPAIPGWEAPLALSVVHAGAFVVASSISMMMCLFFLRDFLMVFLSVYALAAALSLAVLLSTALRALHPRFAYPEVTPPLWEPVAWATVLLLPFTLLLAAAWFLFRHAPRAWLLQDVLSGGLAGHALLSLRFKDLRVASLLTALAVVYDLCWVVVAPAVYAHAPVSILAVAGAPPPPPPTAFMDKVLQLHPADTVPLLLFLPSPLQPGEEEDDAAGEGASGSGRAVVAMGLGAVVVPALLLALARRADLRRQAPPPRTPPPPDRLAYAPLSAACCVVAMGASAAAAAALHRTPPLLLILSLATLGPFLALACAAGS